MDVLRVGGLAIDPLRRRAELDGARSPSNSMADQVVRLANERELAADLSHRLRTAHRAAAERGLAR
ncbi:hypothetical protein SALBM135S_04090 [Streptomyces alboniger]